MRSKKVREWKHEENDKVEKMTHFGGNGAAAEQEWQQDTDPPHGRQISRPQLRTHDAPRTTWTRNTEHDSQVCR